MISLNIDGGAIEADGGASAPVGPSVATPLAQTHYQCHDLLRLRDLHNKS